MKNKDALLVKTLLLSTSGRNILKYSTDKKKKKQIIGGYVGFGILYIMLAAYSAVMSIGYGAYGLIDALPTLCAVSVAAIAFFFTVLKVNGYLFNFKEYDMLMAMPFECRTIASSRFLYMYTKSLPWYLCIALPMLIGYGYFARPGILGYVIWIVFSFLLPIIPMVIASIIGALIAKAGSGMKNKKLIQTILTFAFIIVCICSRFIIDSIIKDGKTETVINDIADAGNVAGKYYPPAEWFRSSVADYSFVGILLFLGTTILLFEIFFPVLGKYYRQINSSLMSSASSKKMKSGDIRQRSIVKTIAYKEIRRMTGSTVYITNIGTGQVLCTIVAIAALFVKADKLIEVMFQGAPISTEMLLPAIPMIIYFLIGMVPATVCSPSLEGKNYWIIESMPISKKDLYKGKMLMNLYITIPVALFGVIALCISAGAGIVNTVIYCITEIILCIFSTCWGCVCGVKHMRLDWENEVEVIKQGTAVTVYLLPNMFITMALIAGVVILGRFMNQLPVIAVIAVIAAILASLSYSHVMRLAQK